MHRTRSLKRISTSAALVVLFGCSRGPELATASLEGNVAEVSFVAPSTIHPKLMLDLRSREQMQHRPFLDAAQRSDLTVTIVRDGESRTVTCNAANSISHGTRDDSRKKLAFIREAENDCDLGSMSGAVYMKIELRWRGGGASPKATAHVFGGK